MKRYILLLTLLVGSGLTTTTSAQSIVLTFDTDAQNFDNFVWSATGPVGWSGGPAVQAPAAAGGWTLGGSFNYRHEFDFASGEQPIMNELSASGLGRFAFDVIVDGTSFPPGVANWYQINVAGNSAGTSWTQVERVTGEAWHNADDNALYATHVDLGFDQLGWNDPEDATGWFQIYFGANSASDFPVQFYIDNVTAYAVPEPSLFALAGVGSLALLFRRRR